MTKLRFQKIIDIYPRDMRSDYKLLEIHFILRNKAGATELTFFFDASFATMNDKTYLSWHSVKKRPAFQNLSCGIMLNKKKINSKQKLPTCWYAASNNIPKNDKVVENYFKFGEDWIWEYLKKKHNEKLKDK